MLLLGVGDVVRLFAGIASPWWIAQPEYWIIPLQTVVCGWLFFIYWKDFQFSPPKALPETLGIGVLVFIIWISPQAFFGAEPRTEGFQPSLVFASPAVQIGMLIIRFIRLVIIVPLLEEIFWRGFLLRYFVNDAFYKVAVGRTTMAGFWIVAFLFMLAHNQADWAAAFITGALYNLLLLRSRSVMSCVIAHALTNLLLGIYIMRTGQWGFW